MTELLAPVRDMVSFTAAVGAGADSVYFGVGALNMRVNSKGISPDELGEVVRIAHEKGVRVYVTVNTIVYDDELDALDELLAHLKACGVDAVICWDFAVIQRVREMGMEFHISTQASVANAEAAEFFHSLGATRVVLARELSIEQIRAIGEKCDIELEVFAHGAMCVSVSGRCFLSQFLAGRSGNRGDCLQPCRRHYKITDTQTGDELAVENDHLLSPKDLCSLPILDKIVASGIHTLKIEGRSRAPEYIAAVTSVYRRALDAIEAGTFCEKLVEELMIELKKVYNRDFSSGFYLGKPGPQGWSDRSGNHATHKKMHVGHVLHYYPKVGVAHVDVLNHPIAVGDTVQIHGATSGVVECEIVELRNTDEEIIQKADRCSATFVVPARVRSNDMVYKIVSADE